MQLLYILTIFSLLGFLGVLGYLIYEKLNSHEKKSISCELLEEKVNRLESYVYELEERLETQTPSSNEELKKKIIAMYEDGKDLFLIENTLDVPRPKVEMVLKFYKLQQKNLNS